MAVIENPGEQPIDVLGATSTANITLEQSGLQIVARGPLEDYSSARVKAESAYKALHGVTNSTINGTRYLSIEALQPPFVIELDENDRWIIGFNVSIIKEPNV